MTPAMDAGNGASFDSIFDSAVSEPESTPVETSAPEPPSEETPSSAAEETAPVEEAATLDFDDDDSEPEKVEQDGKNAYKMSEARWNNFQQAKKFVEAIQDYAPSIEAVKEQAQRASDFRAMEIDFRSGDATAVGEFLNYWGGQSPDGVGAMAQQLPAYLEKTGNSQALRAIESQVSNVIVSRAYNDALRAVEQYGPESQNAKTALYKAQSLDFAVSGKHKTLDQIPKPDPNRRQQSDLQRREQDIAQREDRYMKNEWGAFESQNISGAKEAKLNQQVDRVFKPIEGKFPPKVIGSIRDKVISEAQQALKTNNLEWSRNHQMEINDIQREFVAAHKTGRKTELSPRAAALVGDYEARLARIIPSIAKSYIQDATQNAVAQNKATRDKLAAGAAKSAPGGGGRPAPRSIQNQVSGSNLDEMLTSILG